MNESVAVDRTKLQRPYQKVADQLLSMIEGGTYGAGTRLPSERRLSEEFGVGRPVIREAIVALEIMKAVTVKANSGIYVNTQQKPSPDHEVDLDVGGFELLDARMLIESEIAYLAANAITESGIADLEATMQDMRDANSRGEIDVAELCDDRFHEIIAEQLDNSVLYDIVSEMNVAHQRSPLAVRLFARIHGRGMGRRIEEHELILEALRERDANGARAAMRSHLGCVIAELEAATALETNDAKDSARSPARDTLNPRPARKSIVRKAMRN
ncbi:MAG: FadR/GntR family transcriptional regulator [Sphingorhabdus sp.]